MLRLPQYILNVIGRIEQAGYEAYCVGGCVRDMLMGRVPHDYDVASNAPCDAVTEMFENTVATGLKHGTVTVIADGHAVEVTHYRIDGKYSDGRRPDSVTLTDDFTLDLSRRDFTVNAMGYHPERGIIDKFGGQEDIRRRVIQTVGDPDCRFDEDALRILRAVRFASTLEFTVEPQTLAAVARHAPYLCKVSVERITAEIMRTLGGSRPSALGTVISGGGLSHLGIGDGNIEPVDRMACSADIRLAAVIKLCGGGSNTLRKMRLSNRTANRVHLALERFDMPLPHSDGDIRRWLQSCGDDTADIIRAAGVMKSADTSATVARLAEIIGRGDSYRIDMLAIGGNDLKPLGISGQDIGRTLGKLLEAVIDDPSLNTREQLISLAQHIH